MNVSIVETVMLPIDSIIIRDEFYPRKQFDNETVNRYRQALDKLPPICVNHNMLLIDGYHRLMAHKVEQHKEIPATVEDVSDEQVLWESVRRNAAHGLQLSLEDKRRLGRRFFEEGRSVQEIAAVLSVVDRSVRNWTDDLRRQQEEEEKQRMLEMWLACYTQEKIAEAVGIPQQTVSRQLESTQNGILSEMGTPDSLQVFNLWNFQTNDERYGIDYPGRIPGQILENLLYYYTEPFATVVDPMGGGGTTIDVCKAMYRRYRVYDINPVRQDIKKHDITTGFPAECKGADFIFMDPPYWSQKKGEYSDDVTNLANLDLQTFYATMRSTCESAQKTLKPGGYIAVIIGPTQERGRIYDHAFETTKLLERQFEFVNRIIVPYTTQQAKGYHVADAKEGRYMLKLYRDLLVYRKGD